MPFIPHTADEERSMLQAIGADSIESLFDEIPADMRAGVLNRVPRGVSEMEMLRLLRERFKDAGLRRDLVEDFCGPLFGSVAKAVFGILDEMVTSWMLSEKEYPLEDQAEQIADLVLTGLL